MFISDIKQVNPSIIMIHGYAIYRLYLYVAQMHFTKGRIHILQTKYIDKINIINWDPIGIQLHLLCTQYFHFNHQSIEAYMPISIESPSVISAVQLKHNVVFKMKLMRDLYLIEWHKTTRYLKKRGMFSFSDLKPTNEVCFLKNA